jgi:transcriptional regulator with AAA-type ATPase domain
MPVNPDLGSPGWDQYLPAATNIDRLSFTQLSIADTDQDSMRDIDQGSTQIPTAHDRLWGEDTTNLSLVIADEFKAKWSPRRKFSKMYVRISYITATELIFAYYVNPDNDQHVLLNGTPGTGKTMFANVFFWRLLHLSMANPDRCSHSNPCK